MRTLAVSYDHENEADRDKRPVHNPSGKYWDPYKLENIKTTVFIAALCLGESEFSLEELVLKAMELHNPELNPPVEESIFRALARDPSQFRQKANGLWELV